ncbi:hypothetical protein H9Q69_009707 [Fusarium xylarioides]|uniref:Uncharacterized protein n=1 Tax=Fusarium xylarioides TaxID=221167 RepID=A0A9P7HL38_9HYPO|nr:hypothetical protein H9Q72_012351 [Fusarium xylarioides]KAG5791253.1 hypothetical protein H9Q69_009707 [Fusarium xylarioides]
MYGNPCASDGYLPTSRDHHSPYLERDPGQRARLPIVDMPVSEEIEPAAIVRIRKEMNKRLHDQDKAHFEELQSVRAEMRAMRLDFELQIFDYRRQHEEAIVDLANQASLAGHDSM